MAYTEDITTDTVTLDAGQSLSAVRADGHLSVSTEKADIVLVYIDNGSSGGTPATYDLTHEVSKRGAWRFDHEVLSETARSWRVLSSPTEWRIDVTNQSGTNNQTYRIVVESIVEDAN